MAGTAGLSTREVQGIREALAAGRKTKVQFTGAAGQIAGQVGQVVRLTDPAQGEDFVVVRFGRDELPFSPAEVTLAPRAAARPKPTPPPAQPQAPGPALMLTPPPLPTPRQEKTTIVETPEPTVDDANRAAPAKRVAKPPRPKGPAGLTVTLAYTDGEWLVGAMQGTKALAKPYVIRASDALKMVGLLDVPGVSEAVEQIIAAERESTKAQAEKLRAELAEVEAKLAELGHP